MRTKLCCAAVAAVILVGADAGQSGEAETTVEFAGTRWELMSGRRDNSPMEAASLTFLNDGRLVLQWKVEGYISDRYLLDYDLDSRTGMATFVWKSPVSRLEGKVRLVGHRLVWRSTWRRSPFSREEPNYELHLVLKRSK